MGQASKLQALLRQEVFVLLVDRAHRHGVLAGKAVAVAGGAPPRGGKYHITASPLPNSVSCSFRFMNNSI